MYFAINMQVKIIVYAVRIVDLKGIIYLYILTSCWKGLFVQMVLESPFFGRFCFYLFTEDSFEASSLVQIVAAGW